MEKLEHENEGLWKSLEHMMEAFMRQTLAMSSVRATTISSDTPNAATCAAATHPECYYRQRRSRTRMETSTRAAGSKNEKSKSQRDVTQTFEYSRSSKRKQLGGHVMVSKEAASNENRRLSRAWETKRDTHAKGARGGSSTGNKRK